MPSIGLTKLFGFSRSATAPSYQQQGSETGADPAGAIAYPDVLSAESWKKQRPRAAKFYGDFEMGSILSEVETKFKQLELDQDLPSIDAGLKEPEAFINRLKAMKETDGYRSLSDTIDGAIANAAALDDAVGTTILPSREPTTKIVDALLGLKRQISERVEVINRMPEGFKQKLEQDAVFKTMKATYEATSQNYRNLIDAIGQVRSNPTVALVGERFREGSTGNPARNLVSNVSFWNHTIVRRWPRLAAQVFSDIKAECIDEALSSASNFQMIRDLVESDRPRKEAIDDIEKTLTKLATDVQDAEEKEVLARQQLSDVEKLVKQTKSAAAAEFLLKVGPDYTRAQYSQNIAGIDAAAHQSIQSHLDDIREHTEELVELRASVERKEQEIEQFRASERTEVLEQMDKLQASLARVQSLVGGYQRFWDMLMNEIASL